MADFKQAIKWMKEGKKIRRPNYYEDDYSYLHNGNVMMDNKENLAITLEQFEATDWEIYCEEHEWINYEDIINKNPAIFYKENPQFGWRGCPHPSSYKEDKFCRSCGVMKTEEIKLEVGDIVKSNETCKERFIGKIGKIIEIKGEDVTVLFKDTKWVDGVLFEKQDLIFFNALELDKMMVVMQKMKEALYEKMLKRMNENVFNRRDVKEKIQNAQKRLIKNDFINTNGECHKEVKKIFQEEFGKELL